MTSLIEKLEELQSYTVGATERIPEQTGSWIKSADLRAIIEEYKKQEPVAYVTFQTKEWFGVGNGVGVFSYVKNDDCKYPLFTDPPLPDETVKDAERYRWLREQNWDLSELSVVVNPKVAVKLGHDCPSLNRLDIAIDEAMKAES